MTDTNRGTPAQKLAAFEKAAASLQRAHHCHADLLIAGNIVDASRSRRALYAAIKNYRQAETVLYHQVAGDSARAPDADGTDAP